MNLALHGFLLHVLLSIFNLQHGSLLCSAGEPGYLDFDNLPETNFSCQGKVIGGYYADVEAGCQMFHVCTIGQKDEIMDIKFLCLNGTVFDQETRVCERVDEVDCSKSERFYNLNLELYGNNAVTLSLHENNEDEIDSSDSVEEHQRSTSTRPTTTTTTTTTTSKPSKPSTTPSSSSFSHPTGYPQHFQPQPPFPQVHTSQSKSLYDDKNGGYHHQYIFHNGERNNNQQATSYQLFSSEGVGSTTVQPLQVHQIRYSSTSSPQIIHNEPSTVAPLFHATSSTIQTLLNSNGNSPSLINPIFHNHGIASTTEQFSVHSNNPRETSEYRENGEQSIRPLETAQSTNKGKVSKLTLSPGPTAESSRSVQTKTSSQSSQQQRISGNFLPTPTTDETTVRSFYPTPRVSTKSSQTSQSTSEQVTQHIHVLPPVQIPQLKPHQITINIPPPDLQRIVQNPSSLLPSQSRVIVTAKASVSDESGRPLNTSQLVTLPLPTIPASYDDYKEGDESFDPFYRDVPKIRSNRRVPRRVDGGERRWRTKRSVGQTKNSMVSFIYGGDSKGKQDVQTINASEEVKIESGNDEFKSIKESLIKFRDILFGGEFTDDVIRNLFEGSRVRIGDSGGKTKNLKRDLLEDLEPRASKNFKMKEHGEKMKSEERKTERNSESLEIPVPLDTKASDAEEYIEVDKNEKIEKSMNDEMMDKKYVKVEKTEEISEELKEPEEIVDDVIFDPNEYLKSQSIGDENTSNITEKEQIRTEAPVLSTSESATKETAESYSKSSENQNDAQEPKMLSQEKTLREENKNERLEEPRRNTRRKSSRVRVSRPKSSLRKKESTNKNNESAKLLDDKIPEENVEMNSKIEQIDEHIFEEQESHTSKEVDTRAVNNRYSKNLQTGKDQKVEKENRKIDNEYKTLEKQRKSLEDILNDRESTTVLPSKKKELEEEKEIEETESADEVEYPETAKENVSVEGERFYNEDISMEHESMENESTTTFGNENSEEDDQKVVRNFNSKKNMKLKNSSIEVSSYVESKSKEVGDDEEEDGKESYEYSTMKSGEISSEEVSSEYYESTESFDESIYDVDPDENYKHFRSSEDTTASSEHTYSDETLNPKEEIQEGRDKDESSLSDQEESTEGVLKFTDELPKDRKEDVSENKKSSESDESIALDYVDDNYEPENYKGRESSDSNNVSDEKVNVEMMSDAKADTNEENDEDKSETTTESESSQDKEIETPKDFSTEKTDLLQTTTATTTTTTRPTPPKLFKPISARKIYNYIPPTTTPKPVVIKPRPSLLNPKPAKPPKSYNELAPKPVIRKFTLLTRKSNTFAPIATVRDEDFPESTEIMTTEAMTTTTEATKSEENVLESKLVEPVNISEKEDQAPTMNKQDQDSSSSEQKSPADLKKEEDQGFIPYPISKSGSPSTVDKTLKEADFSSAEFEKQTTTPISSTLIDLEVMSTTVSPMTFTSNEPERSTEPFLSITKAYMEEETSSASSTKSIVQDATEIPVASSAPETTITPETTTKKMEEAEPTTMRPLNRMSAILRKQGGFNCLEKEMYRFYGDTRDCRLFHYCSPGFTSRQVLDFRFVCEESTIFDEESQSCRHDVRNRKCVNRRW